MFGIKSSGCFMIGTVFGFLIAAVLGVIIFFYFHPDLQEKNAEKVEKVWNKVKDNGDHYIKTIKKAPVRKTVSK